MSSTAEIVRQQVIRAASDPKQRLITILMNWRQRLKRGFAFNIETCPDCGGTLRVIACIEDPPLIAKILGLVRSHEAVAAIQARTPPTEERTALKLT